MPTLLQYSPLWMLSTVDWPTALRIGLISTDGSWAVFDSRASMASLKPGTMLPPRNSRRWVMAQTVVAVPKSMTIRFRLGNSFTAPMASATRSAPTSFGSL